MPADESTPVLHPSGLNAQLLPDSKELSTTNANPPGDYQSKVRASEPPPRTRKRSLSPQVMDHKSVKRLAPSLRRHEVDTRETHVQLEEGSLESTSTDTSKTMKAAMVDRATMTLEDSQEMQQTIKDLANEYTQLAEKKVITKANVEDTVAEAVNDELQNFMNGQWTSFLKNEVRDCLNDSLGAILPSHFEQLVREFEPLKENEQLRMQNKELQSTTEALESKVDDVEANYNALDVKLKKKIESLAKSNKSYRGAKEDVKQLRNDLECANNRNREENDRQARAKEERERKATTQAGKDAAEIAGLRGELNKTKAEVCTTKAELSTTKTQLVNLQQHNKKYRGNVPKASDGEIQNLRGQMAFNARQLAQTLAQNIPPTFPLTVKETHQRFQATCPSYAETLLLEPHTRRSLLQAYIWRAADRYVLPENAAITASARRLEDFRLEMFSQPTFKDSVSWASWLAEGWKILEPELAEARKEPETGAFAEATHLLDFVPGGEQTVDAVRELEKSLTDIFTQALELNFMLGSSKAAFEQKYPSNGEHFNPETMEVSGYGEATFASRVLFSVSPSITKHGTADGFRHDSHMVLLKAEVVVEEEFKTPGPVIAET